MTEEEFWTLVAEVREAGGGDMSAVEGHLKTRLQDSDVGGVEAFARHMDAMMDRAYAWPLWAAAYIVQGGCSDDGFMDFRSSLVFLGRETFEAALANPDSLAAFDEAALDGLYHEGLLYVAPEVYEAKSGARLERAKPSPADPSGEAWEEDDEAALKALCPKLFDRYW